MCLDDWRCMPRIPTIEVPYVQQEIAILHMRRNDGSRASSCTCASDEYMYVKQECIWADRAWFGLTRPDLA